MLTHREPRYAGALATTSLRLSRKREITRDHGEDPEPEVGVAEVGGQSFRGQVTEVRALVAFGAARGG
jgi:hypothetical protein